MVLKNKARQDLQQKFLELVEQYNLGAYTAEELAVYDLIIQDAPLNDKEHNKLKEIAKELTDKMQEMLVIDWRKKQRTKARVKNMIEEVLDSLPESYDELWPKTCSEVYMHIFEKYPGQGQSVYNQ
jgi:type I restriction enzyme R subunit